MRLKPELYLSNNVYSKGCLFQIYESDHNRRYIGNPLDYGPEKHINTRRQAFSFIMQIIISSLASTNYNKHGEMFDKFLRDIRWTSSEFIKFDRPACYEYLKNLDFDCKVQVIKYLKDIYSRILDNRRDRACFMWVLLKFFKIDMGEQSQYPEKFVVLEQNVPKFNDFATKDCRWIKGIKFMETENSTCNNSDHITNINKFIQTQKEDTKMATNTPDQKTLYKFIADNGVETFCNFLAVDSSLKWVIEVKGTGVVMSVEKDKLEEVCPFTIYLRNIMSKEGTHYSVENHTDLIQVGMIIFTAGCLYIIEKVNTKVKSTYTIDPSNWQIIPTTPFVPTVKADEKPKF